MADHQFIKTPTGEVKVRFKCPGCQSAINATMNDVGRQDQCPKCRTAFTVPGAEGKERLRQQQAKVMPEPENAFDSVSHEAAPYTPTPAPLPAEDSGEKWLTPPRYKAIEALSSIYRALAVVVGIVWTLTGFAILANSISNGFATDGILTVVVGTISTVIVVCFLLAFSELLKLAISAERSLFEIANSTRSRH